MLSEHQILLGVLAAVFASLPAAILIRSFFPHSDRRVAGERAAMPVAAEAVPADVLVPPSLPPVWIPSPADLEVQASPDVPHQHTWTKKDAWFAVILALVVASLLGPVTAGAQSGEAGGGSGAGEGISLTWELFVISITFQAGIMALVLGYLCAHRRFDAVTLFGLRRMTLPKAAVTALLCIVPAVFLLNIVTFYLLPVIQHLTGIDVKPQMLVEKAPEITGTGARVLMFIALCVGAPLMEELIFRGVLFSVAAGFIHPVYANVASSLLFGVIHNNLLSLVPLTLLGMLFAAVYQRTRSLAIPILMHAMFNCFQFFLLLYGPKEFQ